jgi:plasmid stability protein
MCYFSIATDELASGDAWALGPHRLVCGEDSDAAAFFRDRRRDRGGAPRAAAADLFPIRPSACILQAMKTMICRHSMNQLTVRNVSAEIVRSLKQRASAHGRSAEAEHREILREALREGADDFEARAKILRERLRSTVNVSEIIRADRDRDGAA